MARAPHAVFAASPGTNAQARTCALVGRLREHHPATADHVRRVAGVAAAIAEALELPPAEVEALRLAALVHDVGKVDVPTAVLDGQGPLSAAAARAIHRHPLTGLDQLAACGGPWSRVVVDVVLLHHERWDGSGYPFGLVGAATPLAARVCAVADVYDAMIAGRTYAPACPLERTLAYLAAHAGSLFDPDVVAALARACRHPAA